MTKNNRSRAIFKLICEKNNFNRDPNRNVFEKGGKTIAFSVSYKEYVECRQFYNDCDALLSYHTDSNKWLIVSRKTLTVSDKCNRISPNGKKSYSAKCELQLCKPINIKI